MSIASMAGPSYPSAVQLHAPFRSQQHISPGPSVSCRALGAAWWREAETRGIFMPETYVVTNNLLADHARRKAA